MWCSSFEVEEGRKERRVVEGGIDALKYFFSAQAEKGRAIGRRE
jgi:hypothetical protein